jgi:ATP adenylyltransferase
MIEPIWNGWRAAYLTGEGRGDPLGDGSLFTQILNSGLPDEATNVVYRGPKTFAIMNAFPYNPGHLLVLPYAELADLTDLDADTTIELWATVTAAVQAVRTAMHPAGVNVGVNLGRAAGGSVPDHLHVHVVPRWGGDANFMTTVANATTIPEALNVTAARIRTAWPSS